jgi:hypothetical protein
MSTKRIPIHRPIRAQIPLEALDLFRDMKNSNAPVCRSTGTEGIGSGKDVPDANAGGTCTRD